MKIHKVVQTSGRFTKFTNSCVRAGDSQKLISSCVRSEDSRNSCVRAERLQNSQPFVQPVVGAPVDADRVPVETGAEPIHHVSLPSLRW